ncbi:MAG TPA: SigB/SigF/SigG family RNA polymerase sigma factor [Thermoleophilaceae bacterium]
MLDLYDRPAPTRPAPRSATGAADVLFARYRRGDFAARRLLIERFLPLARNLARRYEGRGEPLDDLVQVASVGLVKAIDRFEPGRGFKFSSYAVPTMLGELRRHFRDSGWAVHLARDMQERVLKVQAAVERLSGQLGRSPNPQQVADELKMSVEHVLEAIEANSSYKAASLDAPAPSSLDDGGNQADMVGVVDERFELIEAAASIAPALRALPERERTILYLRFVKDLSQTQIAKQIGASQVHVSRLIRQALEDVRSETE